MATQAEVIRRNIQDNQRRDLERQMAFGNPPVEELANGIPSSSNDAALAAHLKELRDTNAEYARLRTEESRQQWETIAADNFRRTQADKQNLADQASMAKANKEHEAKIVGDSLALQMQELTDSFPPNWTPETLPLDQLQKLSNLRQRVQDLAASTGAQGLADGVLESGGPMAPANVLGMNKPQQVQTEVKDNGDGTYTVQLETGEIFKGSATEVMQAQANAHVSTKRWAQQWKQKAETPQSGQTYQGTETIQNQPPQQTPEPTQQDSIAGWWAAETASALAKELGFTDKNELMQWGANVNKTVEAVKDFNDQQTALQFMGLCPDFPQTEQANQALLGIVDAHGWQYTPENLQAAHLLAVRNGAYQPLTQEQIRVASGEQIPVNRPPAPPMLSGNNPELTSGGNQDPWSMSMGDLRKQAIRQELEGHRR